MVPFKVASSKPRCEQPGEKEDYMKLAWTLTHDKDETYVYNTTGCMPCCTRNEISAKLTGKDVIEVDNEFKNYYIQGRAQKTLLSSLARVRSGLMGCASAALG